MQNIVKTLALVLVLANLLMLAVLSPVNAAMQNNIISQEKIKSLTYNAIKDYMNQFVDCVNQQYNPKQDVQHMNEYYNDYSLDKELSKCQARLNNAYFQ